MKRTYILMIAVVLIAIALIGCKNEPEQKGKTTPPVVQTVKINETDAVTTGAYNSLDAETTEAKYQFYMDKNSTTAVLKTQAYDHMENKWPDEWTTYTGTYTKEKYDKVITETDTYKEITKTWMYSVTFNSVDDPMYEATVHAYDGLFDVRYVSGYGDDKTKSGGYDAYLVDGTVVAFEVTTNKDGAPSALIGVGNWTL